jgi:hypothetical protein
MEIAMRMPKINIMKFAAALAPIALAGAIMAAAASTPASAHSSAAAAAASTAPSTNPQLAQVGKPAKQFVVYNYTGHYLTLLDTEGGSSSGAFSDPPPPNGTTVKPGEAIGFQVSSYEFWENSPIAHFALYTYEPNGIEPWVALVDVVMNNWQPNRIYGSNCRIIPPRPGETIPFPFSCTDDPKGANPDPKPILVIG